MDFVAECRDAKQMYTKKYNAILQMLRKRAEFEIECMLQTFEWKQQFLAGCKQGKKIVEIPLPKDKEFMLPNTQHLVNVQLGIYTLRYLPESHLVQIPGAPTFVEAFGKTLPKGIHINHESMKANHFRYLCLELVDE